MARQPICSTVKATAVISMLMFPAILTWSSCSQNYGPKDAVALYEDCYFDEGPSFSELSTGYYTGKKIAYIYIELPDQRRYLLHELPVEVAEELLKSKVPIDEEMLYADDFSHFSYRNGKLVAAKLARGSDLFRISAHKEGPYLSFPIDKETLIREFGEPVKWRRPFKQSTGP